MRDVYQCNSLRSCVKKCTLLLLFFCAATISKAQKGKNDINSIQEFPTTKYLNQVNTKINKYNSRITHKTEKTLVKLIKWENKIHRLLQKVNPQTAEQLFGNNQTTFATLLQKIKVGKQVAENYQVQYDEYKDKLTTSVKYIQKYAQIVDSTKIKEVAKKLDALNNSSLEEGGAVQQFIKERKKQLIDQSLQFIGKSKYIGKINKETYYYVETLRNYKEIFSDEKKAEETVKNILNNLPAFNNFFKKNSLFSSFFPSFEGGNVSEFTSIQAYDGLQTRQSLGQIMQSRISTGGPNATQAVQHQIQNGQTQLATLKDKIAKYGSNFDGEIPDFKPNNQKSKTFAQRLEYGTGVQFSKPNSFLPTTADIALNIGYKLNDKSSFGLGASYKLGIGSIEHINFSNQGIGLRSYVDWKLPAYKKKTGKGFFLSGGYEMNYLAQLNSSVNNNALSNGGWQSSGLLGLSKKIAAKGKSAKVQLLFDFLYKQHLPYSQPLLYRVSYNLK